MDNNEICEIMKQRREDLGLTLDDVAQQVGVNQSTVSRWESGQIEEMKRGKVEKLADALKLSPAMLMGWDDYLKLNSEQVELILNYNKMTDSLKARLLAYSQMLLDTLSEKFSDKALENMNIAQKFSDDTAEQLRKTYEAIEKKKEE